MGVSSPHSSQARLGSSCSLLFLPGTCLSEFALTVASAAPGFLQLFSRPFHFTGQVSTCQSGLPSLPSLNYPPAILLLLGSTLISTWHSTCCFFSCFCLPPVIRMWTPSSQESCFVFCVTTTFRKNVWPTIHAQHLLERMSNHQKKDLEFLGSQSLTLFFWGWCSGLSSGQARTLTTDLRIWIKVVGRDTWEQKQSQSCYSED